ncbi:cupin domain-containing protein [Streptomyces paradoxus]|uniref:Transcriptional regulator with XRE-family HTH domain/quercetin dioxygenase-like cupin family protein n=1 Tax=Streptomyces paradoxus TaxID=66375 RepID=A0A7W9T5D0_9ACTN|nr:cupin domain-containing protein [Streptomyces paradoxus]MBB6074400.1 transcriptional regulator with XRE-family HTH domain/quercetin dioxygenase-like cupin family protein [Streptomyces paradoxus]
MPVLPGPGLTERVTALGGDLRAGPRTGGGAGWQVRAVFPAGKQGRLDSWRQDLHTLFNEAAQAAHIARAEEPPVSPAVVPPVGARIRQARQERGTSLRALAREVGVSPSLVSQIETGKSQPSVSTLYAITTALGISVESLFDIRESAVASAPGASPGTVPHALAALAADPGRRIGPLVGAGARETLELDSGVVWERLGRVPGAETDFLLVTYRPGGSSSGSGALMRHPGTEYGYLTSGELVLTLGFEEYTLRPGDSVCFESTTPHRYRNDGEVPAVGVWFVSGDVQ